MSRLLLIESWSGDEIAVSRGRSFRRSDGWLNIVRRLEFVGALARGLVRGAAPTAATQQGKRIRAKADVPVLRATGSSGDRFCPATPPQ
jgi:hypothetical protein